MAEKKYIQQKLKIVVTIVNREKAEFFLDQMETMGINMQMSIEGEGTAPHNLANFWGLAHKDREVILSFVPEDKVKKVFKALVNAYNHKTPLYIENGFVKEKYDCKFSIILKGE